MRVPFRALTIVCCLISVRATVSAEPLSAGDATLRAVHFVDAGEGWAIGDEGVIKHTTDGGKTWEHQFSGTRASLRSMYFLNPYTGWIVGRIERPGTGSSGVVLSTTDGGLKWKTISNNSIPGLNTVKFFNERNGIVAGDGADAFPSGLFSTIDGGRSWKPIAGARATTWLTGDFSDADTGVLAGAWSRLAPIRDGAMAAADVDSLGGRSVRSLKLFGESAVAVGQGGLIMVSRDTAGVRWGLPDLKLSKELRAAIDFHAVAVVGKTIWAAGRPGSILFMSKDGGLTWESKPTGQTVPIHGLYFLDDRHGWAVGDLGTIMLTKDGGTTWTVQSQGALRCAALVIASSAETVPYETLAAIGADEGYLTAVMAMTSAVSTPPDRRYDSEADRLSAAIRAVDAARSTDSERLSAAIRMVGGAVGEQSWHFPIAGHEANDSVDPILSAWADRHQEKPGDALVRQIVAAIRIWQPDVVIVADPSEEPMGRVMYETVRRAFEQAADEKVHAEQLGALHLKPWAPRKLFSTLPKADPAHFRLDLGAWRERLADNAADYAVAATRLWSDRPTPEQRGYRLSAARVKDTSPTAAFFDGIALAPGGAARRVLPTISDADAARKQHAAVLMEKRRNAQAILKFHGDPVAREQAVSVLADAVKDLPASDAGKALYSAARSLVDQGRWLAAREAFLMLVDKYPGHPLSAEATRWLVRHQASSEARRRQELGQFVEFNDVRIEVKDRPAPSPGTRPVNRSPNELQVIQATHREEFDGFRSARKWYEGALELESRIAGQGDLFARDPGLNLCLAAARRQLGRVEESQRWLFRYLTETAPPVGLPAAKSADPWRDCVMLESWLVSRTVQGVPPKPVGTAGFTTRRPHLDGKLDDDCWQRAQSMPLSVMLGEAGADFGCRDAIERMTKESAADPKSAAAALPSAIGKTTRAMFSFDDDYLYVAVVCRHPAGLRKDAVAKRSRDMNLGGHDRVQFLIDLDRDYQTYFRFEIDQRGAVAEDCWGDRTWNPKWFVAVTSDETSWTAEAAIPLAELTGESVDPGKLWAVNVVRTIPGRGLQAWSGPAGVKVRPEGMGILTFQGGAKQPAPPKN